MATSLSLTRLNNTSRDNVINRILEIVAEAPGCQIADMAKSLPDVTLREVFSSLCYLKKSGQLEMVVGSQGAVFTLSPRLFH
jgi:hypothetical protein